MRFLIALTLIGTCVASAAPEEGVVRLCVSAGRMFPETEPELRATVTRLLDEAKAPVPTEPLFACVVPHGPYGISGKVAAEAFKYLKPGQFKRVIVLGASHAEMAFEDCSMDAVDAYATPMGFVPLDKVAVRTLTYSTLFATRALRYNHKEKGFLSESERKPLHEYEHSIEMVLPFLQERLGKFELVPILVGELTNGTGQYNEKRTEAVAMQLKRIMDSETLLVVSTDFTHFGNDFSYRPFDSDILNKIDKLDDAGLTRLAANDYDGFEKFIHSTKVPICGLNALRVLEKLLPSNAHGVLLGHDTSGRFYNDENRSVSYASMNFYLSDKPRPMVMPDPVEISRLESPDALAAAERAAKGRSTASKESVPAPEKATPEIAEPAKRAPEASAPAAQPSGPRPAPVNLTNIRRGNGE